MNRTLIAAVLTLAVASALAADGYALAHQGDLDPSAQDRRATGGEGARHDWPRVATRATGESRSGCDLDGLLSAGSLYAASDCAGGS